MAAADANGNGEVLPIVDAFFILDEFFSAGSPEIPAPFPDCGVDEASVEALGCEVSSCQ